MKCLVVCPTYGRLPYLGRMLASFLSQEYDDKHLVIINDDKNVEICCAGENVTVLNCNRKLTVAEKRNMGVSMGYHDIIFPLDDDDVFLPNRITNHLSKYKNNMAYRNIPCYIIYGDEFYIAPSAPNSISFRKKEWFDIGGYKPTLHYRADDAHIYNEIKKRNNLLEEDDPNNIDFVYHFGGVNYHLTCTEPDDIDEIAYKQLVDMKILNGKFWIEPDFEEYQKILSLVKKYDGTPIKIQHISEGKINI